MMVGVIGLILLRAAAAVLILYLLYVVFRRLSGVDQINSVLHLQKYFREKVYPQKELASYLQKIELRENLLAAPKDKKVRLQGARQVTSWEHVQQELKSEYYQRTGRRMGDKNKHVTLDRWYRTEEWIQDILAGKARQKELCTTPAEERRAELNKELEKIRRKRREMENLKRK